VNGSGSVKKIFFFFFKKEKYIVNTKNIFFLFHLIFLQKNIKGMNLINILLFE
jgi:hypothetical protein